MKDNYLNAEEKKKRQEDFEKLVLTETGSLKVEEELKPYLVRINRNPKLMTIDSKGFEKSRDPDQYNPSICYINIAYFQDLYPFFDDKLKNILQEKLEIADYDGELEYVAMCPWVKDSSVYKSEMGYVKNRDHFNIWNFRIQFNYYSFDRLHVCLEALTACLENLKVD